ncbi:hypothetical protein ACWD25_41310 [Streptomyces sp. NPDC002920]
MALEASDRPARSRSGSGPLSEVVAYPLRYAHSLDAEIRTLATSGTFGRPHRPALPGLEGFAGTVLHAAE